MGMKGVLPFVGMVIVQIAQVGLLIAGKEAMSNGMTNFTFVFYSNSLSSIVLLPSFLIHRSPRPPLTFSLISGFFLLGLIGCLTQLLGYAGIQYTNASFVSAMMNLIPAFTFILAIIVRMEKLDIRSSSTLAKCIGTIVSIIGAFIVTLYKGPIILGRFSDLNSSGSGHHLSMQLSQWIIGALFLALNCALSATYIIIQALLLEKYPAELIVVFFYTFFVAILTGIFSLIVEKDPSAWRIQPDVRLIALLYSVFFGSAFSSSIVAWCLSRIGPLFVAIFHPLGVVIATSLGIIFLGDIFYLGSLVGSAIIVIGFYSVIWGKAREEKLFEEDGVKILESSCENAPLLQNNVSEGRESLV